MGVMDTTMTIIMMGIITTGIITITTNTIVTTIAAAETATKTYDVTTGSGN
jgi:hypothetical protein